MNKQEILSFEISISEHQGNQCVMGNYKIGPESFRIFFYEKIRKKINIYKINLREKKVHGPEYINIDFIQNKIDALNSMVNIDKTGQIKPDTKTIDDYMTPKITKYNDLVEKIKENFSKTKDVNLSEVFKIKLMTLNNYYYDREVLLVFDGYNVYKYIEDKKNK